MNSPNLDTIYAWCSICEMIVAPDEYDKNNVHIGCGAICEDVHVVCVGTIAKLLARYNNPTTPTTEADHES